jgi:hypothetical protein
MGINRKLSKNPSTLSKSKLLFSHSTIDLKTITTDTNK